MKNRSLRNEHRVRFTKQIVEENDAGVTKRTRIKTADYMTFRAWVRRYKSDAPRLPEKARKILGGGND